MSIFEKFIPNRTISALRGAPTHPFREALVNIAFVALATFAIFGSAACAVHLVFAR